MIVDKVFDTVYEEASRYITKWRGAAFLTSWLLLSGTLFNFSELSLWEEGAGSVGSDFVESLLSLPFYKLVYLIVSAFYVSPMVSSKFAMVVVRREVVRAEPLISSIDSVVAKIADNELPARLEIAKADAVIGEKQMEFKKALNESYVFSLLVLLLLSYVGAVSWGWFLFFSIPWPFLSYFLLQEFLTLYLIRIYMFKRISDKLSKSMLGSCL